MSESENSDHARVLAPAPVFYIFALVAGFAIHYLWPVTLGSSSVMTAFGLALVTISIPIVLFALLAMRRANTAFDARRSTIAIVVDGPFRFSRNPTYLSLTLLALGISLAFNSVWLLASAAVATGLTQWLVIKPEERYLTTKFGEEYCSYARGVRRWI